MKEISKWWCAKELVSTYKILVLERDEDNMEEIINKDEFLLENRTSFIKLKENIRSNISSSFVRDKIKRGKSIRYLTPDEVYYYIEDNNLYNLL